MGRPAANASHVPDPFFMTNSIPSVDTRWMPTVRKSGGYGFCFDMQEQKTVETHPSHKKKRVQEWLVLPLNKFSLVQQSTVIIIIYKVSKTYQWNVVGGDG